MTIPYGIGLPVVVGGRYSATSGRGRGSGRRSDFTWPDPYVSLTTGGAVNQFRNRMDGTAVAAVQGQFGGGASLLTVQAGGGANTVAPAVVLTGNGGGAGQLIRATNGPSIWLRTTKSKQSFPAGMSDFEVTVVTCRCAYVGLVGNQTIDAGLQVTNTGGFYIVQSTPGFAFLRKAPNQLYFSVQPTNISGHTDFLISGAGFDETKSHDYTMVFQSAANNQDASVTAYLDWVPVKKLTWSAGSIGVTMPDISATSLPMIPQAIMGLNGNLWISAPDGIRIVQAATLFDAIY